MAGVVFDSRFNQQLRLFTFNVGGGEAEGFIMICIWCRRGESKAGTPIEIAKRKEAPMLSMCTYVHTCINSFDCKFHSIICRKIKSRGDLCVRCTCTKQNPIPVDSIWNYFFVAPYKSGRWMYNIFPLLYAILRLKYVIHWIQNCTHLFRHFVDCVVCCSNGIFTYCCFWKIKIAIFVSTAYFSGFFTDYRLEKIFRQIALLPISIIVGIITSLWQQ